MCTTICTKMLFFCSIDSARVSLTLLRNIHTVVFFIFHCCSIFFWFFVFLLSIGTAQIFMIVGMVKTMINHLHKSVQTWRKEWCYQCKPLCLFLYSILFYSQLNAFLNLEDERLKDFFFSSFFFLLSSSSF